MLRLIGVSAGVEHIAESGSPPQSSRRFRMLASRLARPSDGNKPGWRRMPDLDTERINRIEEQIDRDLDFLR
jgi:hypothetical protein